MGPNTNEKVRTWSLKDQCAHVRAMAHYAMCVKEVMVKGTVRVK